MLVSMRTASDLMTETFPAASTTCTRTVFVPSAATPPKAGSERSQLNVGVYGMVFVYPGSSLHGAGLQIGALLVALIATGSPGGPLATSVTLTSLPGTASAPFSIETDVSDGGTVSPSWRASTAPSAGPAPIPPMSNTRPSPAVTDAP